MVLHYGPSHLLPARAGMIHRQLVGLSWPEASPRTRGDDPDAARCWDVASAAWPGSSLS